MPSNPNRDARPALEWLRVAVPPLLWLAALAASVAISGCAASHHGTLPSSLGVPISSDAMRSALAEPGPIRLEKVVAADWAVARSGLINLDHPRARAAGLEDGDEPIEVSFYVLRHPTRGTFLVDTGVERGLGDPASSERIGFLVRQAMNTDALRVRITTADWLAREGGHVDGVLLTHLHLDHVLGVPDLPEGTPIYAGPGETEATSFLHAFSRGTIDRFLEPAGPIREWHFEPDASGRFAGVLDVFGDGSLFALHVPGHTPGSTAFAVRTVDGPVLLLGDACHTRWGWEHDVEPGTFSLDRAQSALSLARLRELAAQVPGIRVYPGHQGLDTPAEGAIGSR